MRTIPMKTAGVIFILIVLTCANALAQGDSPVIIAFDENSKRIDLLTGRELPDYRFAVRGSIKFYLDRLDSPNDFFNFYHDGVRRGRIADLNMMEKVQPQFDIWRIIYKSGSKNTPRLHHKAVSFTPLSTATMKPERQVCVLLNDLRLIVWDSEDYDSKVIEWGRTHQR